MGRPYAPGHRPFGGSEVNPRALLSLPLSWEFNLDCINRHHSTQYCRDEHRLRKSKMFPRRTCWCRPASALSYELNQAPVESRIAPGAGEYRARTLELPNDVALRDAGPGRPPDRSGA